MKCKKEKKKENKTNNKINKQINKPTVEAIVLSTQEKILFKKL